MRRSPSRIPAGLALVWLSLLAACGAPTGAPERYDIAVVGGTLIDGTGARPRRLDVAVRDGRVVAIGAVDRADADRIIDATGLVVSPGFVDLHSHADLILLGDRALQDRLLSAKIRQGVTTIVVGNCGLGVAPADARAAEILAGINGWMTPDGVTAGPLSVAGYLETVERRGVGLNVATLVPHGPIRISAMGLQPGAPTAAQLQAMRRAVEDGLRDGAFGLSTGLIYPPGMYSSTEELVELARVVAARDALFTSHVRGSSETLLPATEELIQIARASGARVHHSHMEAVGERFWPAIPQMIALEDRARAAGLRVSHDVFPYTRAATMMTAIFPTWALEGGVPALLERLEDPQDRRRIRREIAEQRPEWPPWTTGGWPHNLVGAVGWDGILVSSLAPGGPAELLGRSLEEIASSRNADPFDVVVELLIDQQGRVGQQIAEISGREDAPGGLLDILAHPAGAVISDAEDYGRGTPHPAHAGAFARALRWNRELAFASLEELVRRMTGYPASLIGLADRGIVREGGAADLVVFDPERIADRATWTSPREPAAGVPYVIVNGAIIVDAGRFRGGPPHGRVLRAGPPA